MPDRYEELYRGFRAGSNLLQVDAVCVPLFIRRAGIGRCLLHQLAEIVFDHLDAFFDFGERCLVGHGCLE